MGGGGIFAAQGNVTVAGGQVNSNIANGIGGGICTLAGNVYLTGGGQVQLNSATGVGGGIYESAFASTQGVNLTSATLDGNDSTQSGGGIYINTGTISVLDSTISGNVARLMAGGGIDDADAYGGVIVTNSTIGGNSAGTAGGGINSAGTATINNSTIALNGLAASGIGAGIDAAGSIDINNSIVAGNYAGTTAVQQDISGTVLGSNNAIGSARSAGGLIDGTNDNFVGLNGAGTRAVNTIIDTTLASNGGQTETYALAPGSVASGSGDSALNPDTVGDYDQRGPGYPRTIDGAMDIGAVQDGTLGMPDHLAFKEQPSNIAAGMEIGPSVQVEVLDKYGNLETGDYSDRITLSVDSGPGDFASGSTTTEAVNGGVATFNNIQFDTAGTYTLGETGSNNLSGDDSNSFTISAGAADYLTFGVEPGNTTAGVAIGPAVQVEVMDKYGNLLTDDYSDRVSVTIATGPGSSALGSGTTAIVNGGVATFNYLVLDRAGTYALKESGNGGLKGVNSGNFTISPAAADHLGFGVQPGNTTAGMAIGPGVKVEIFDQYDNLLTGDNADQVTLAVASGPGSFASGSTTTATVTDGVATFNNLVFDTAGNYTLAESANGVLSGYNSSSFHVAAGAANHLIFSVQPGNTTAGLAINPAVKVELLDRYGNLVNSDNNGQVALDVVSSPGFAIESTTATVQGGVATFRELTIGASGTDYTLQASLGGQDTVASNSFEVTPAHLSLTRSVISLSPSFIQAGNSTTIALQAEDAFGNKETNGGLKVAFGLGSAVGGQGTFSAVTDHGNGIYTATFTGTLAGKNTIKAYIDGQAVTSTAPSIAVVTGPLSLAKSPVTLSSKSMKAGGTVTVTLQPEDAGGNKLNLGSGQTILFSLTSGQGTFGTVIANKNGTYSTTFTTTSAGSYTIETTINGQDVTSTASTLSVTPAAVSLANSVLNVSQGSVQKGSQVTITLKAVDAYGNQEAAGLAIVFMLGSGGGKGTFGKIAYAGNGIYQATFTPTTAGSDIIEATIAGAKVKSTGSIAVTP
jgi:hypothetical protein